MNAIISKKFPATDELNQELGTITLEHLWADVWGLKYKRIDNKAAPTHWAGAIRKALAEAENKNARQVAFRVVKDEYSNQFSQLLPQLNFKKKSERVEYKKLIVELPDDHGSPLNWQTAEELKWSPTDIARILKLVSQGDPDTDPNDDPLLFIQDFLAVPVLSSGLGCIHIGFFGDEIAALSVVQINPTSGWSRISYMGVSPKFRKMSFGKWVHRHSFKIMKLQGGNLYHGGTTATNKSMIKLFELHGCDLFCKMEEWTYLIKANCQ